MEDLRVEKQSKRTISYLIGAAIFLIAFMGITLFLMLNWARTGIELQEMRKEGVIEQTQTTP